MPPRLALADSSPGFRRLSKMVSFSLSKTFLGATVCAAAGDAAISATEAMTTAVQDTVLRAIMIEYPSVSNWVDEIQAHSVCEGWPALPPLPVRPEKVFAAADAATGCISVV